MKKKFLSTLLAMVMLAALSACGTSPKSDSSAKELDLVESNTSQSSESDHQGTQVNKTLEPFNRNASLAETVLVEENGVKITATGLSYTAYSVDLELTIENNSGENLSFVSGSLGYSCNSVNGYMIKDGYLNCEVANGKKANETISFPYTSLMFYGVNEIADIEVGFSMMDDEYNTTYLGPQQLKTTSFEAYDYDKDYYQETISSEAAMNAFGYKMVNFVQDGVYEENGVILCSSSVITNQEGKTALLLELKNTTDNMVYLSTSNITINGLLVNSSTWSSDAINPGKRCIVDIELESVLEPDYWSVFGITDVGSISVSLTQRSEEGLEIAPKTPVEIVVPNTNDGYDASGDEVYNNNGLKIVFKKLVEDSSAYSSDLNVLLLAENKSGRTLSINDVFQSLSVNGCMTDYLYYSQELKDGESAILSIKLKDLSLKKNEIASASDIKEIEMGIEIKEGYNVIDEPILAIALEK